MRQVTLENKDITLEKTYGKQKEFLQDIIKSVNNFFSSSD